MTTPWNYGNLFERIDAIAQKDRTAIVHGDRLVHWEDLIRRTNNLARNLIDRGRRPGEKIAFYMRNRPEYVEGVISGFKARLTHVNVNYRYVSGEIRYLLDNADASVVVYDAEYRDIITSIRGDLPLVEDWLEVGGDGSYEMLVETGDGTPLEQARSADDLLFVYTGGTTGMPKGVMWRHEDMILVQNPGADPTKGIPACKTLDELIERTKNQADYPISLTLPPLMHGTGLMFAINALAAAGQCVMLDTPSFNGDRALELIDRHHVDRVSLVGDAFAQPLLNSLERMNGRYDVSSIRFMTSSGVMWSQEVKQGLLKHNPNMTLYDAFSSTEAIGLGRSVTSSDNDVEGAKFQLGPMCQVFDEDNQPVEPGSGKEGLVAVTGYLPLGYYKDEKKTSETFKTVDGVRYSIPGDWATVEADGTIRLLGRGSNCINTGGEKVFPEEVEQALKNHPSVEDVFVVGLDDALWGQAIHAVVQPKGESRPDSLLLKEHVGNQLARYKIPRYIWFTSQLKRAPNGKPDYNEARDFASREMLAAT